MSEKPKFKFWSDPGHGWIEVTRKLFIELGGKMEDVSTCSYQSHGGEILYLEEDCDGAILAKLIERKYGGDWMDVSEWCEEHRDKIFIRDLDSVTINKPEWEGVQVVVTKYCDKWGAYPSQTSSEAQSQFEADMEMGDHLGLG